MPSNNSKPVPPPNLSRRVEAVEAEAARRQALEADTRYFESRRRAKRRIRKVFVGEYGPGAYNPDGLTIVYTRDALILAVPVNDDLLKLDDTVAPSTFAGNPNGRSVPDMIRWFKREI